MAPPLAPPLAPVLALILVLLLATAAPLRAQDLNEGQLRARFVVNFLRFTEWPAKTFAAADAPVQICVLGSADPFQGALHGAVAAGRPIVLHAGIAADDAGGCNLLYVPDSEVRRVVSARDAIGKRAVLIVGESEAVLDLGGMIALRASGSHLAFVVNLTAARRAQLNFSPQMLHAAAEVLQ